MGGRISKRSADDEPELFAIATPHPTMQYIYPVYAIPMDPAGLQSPGSSSSKASKSKKRRKTITVIGEEDTATMVIPPPNTSTGTWFHYHVDDAGHIDYVHPGTAIPTPPALPRNANTYFGSPELLNASPRPPPVPYSHPMAVGPPPPRRRSEPSSHFTSNPHSPRGRSVSPDRAPALTPDRSFVSSPGSQSTFSSQRHHAHFAPEPQIIFPRGTPFPSRHKHLVAQDRDEYEEDLMSANAFSQRQGQQLGYAYGEDPSARYSPSSQPRFAVYSPERNSPRPMSPTPPSELSSLGNPLPKRIWREDAPSPTGSFRPGQMFVGADAHY